MDWEAGTCLRNKQHQIARLVCSRLRKVCANKTDQFPLFSPQNMQAINETENPLRQALAVDKPKFREDPFFRSVFSPCFYDLSQANVQSEPQ